MRRFVSGFSRSGGVGVDPGGNRGRAGLAADLPVPAPGYYPPVLPPALYDWTGIYFGGHVGAGLLSDSFSHGDDSAAHGDPHLHATLGPAGMIGGGQAGVNFEFAPWVVGVEARGPRPI